MSKSSFLDHDDPVPSYDESVYSAQPRSALHQRLDQVRLDRVRDILSTHVDPLLEAQADSGLYKTVFLLIPSNVSSLQPQASEQSSYSTPKEPEVLGFASTDVVHLVRLKGEEHTLQFWRQPAVVEELTVNLRMRLELGGHRVEQDTSHASVPDPTPPVEPTPPSPLEKKKSSSWFRSSSKPKKQSRSWLNPTIPSEAIVIDHKLGWRGKHEEASENKSLARGSVRVNVEWKEVCVRVENELGLYETRKGPGICLSVEFGSR
ncbi:hypothetical protein PISL3812_07528 [Talaromyces islandicus]|uniref:Uncharacterized protein n=1 Tax=Talaromyces islandicus TaxID=28573 RepID=A0A0U1M4L5_TALIS|nr:hypothetical protein PISL3812_07528 [Talaromyces islandicus]